MSVINQETRIKVSSNVDKFSNKANLIDGSADTCWSSAQGSPQSIQLKLDRQYTIHTLLLTFQGGFSGKSCQIVYYVDGVQTDQQAFYPADNNTAQSFSVNPSGVPANSLKLLFNSSTDFYGRVTVYSLDLTGSLAA